MSDLLEAIEGAEKAIVQSRLGDWTAVLVDGVPPRMHRLWMRFGAARIYLHRTLADNDDADAAFWHAHPWPFAVHLLEGSYTMRLGNRCSVFGEIELSEGDRYEMLDPGAHHAVIPHVDCLSVMLAGRRYPEPVNAWKGSENYPPLPSVFAEKLLADARAALIQSRA